MIKPPKRFLLYPRNIAPTNPESLCDLLLRPLIPAMLQTEQPNNNILFAVIQYIKILVNLALYNLQLHFIDNFIRLDTKISINVIFILIRSIES